jgi:chemotaxis protein MotB
MKPAPHLSRSGHDRWLVSYADLVTLLFAFFTTLYGAAAVKAGDRPETTIGDAMVEVAAATPADPFATPAPVMPSVEALRERLETRLEDDVRLKRADVVQDGRGVVVSLPESAAFAPGSAQVSTQARTLIAKVIVELRDGDYALRIEGHTDDLPIQTSRYRSNWELSTARAGAVVDYLIQEQHIAPARLSAAGYAEFHPLVPNDSAANRARNRRIDIVVIGTGDASVMATR